MTWRWTLERGRWTLRPSALPRGVADAGFLGRSIGENRGGLPWPTSDQVSLEQVHGAEVVEVRSPGRVAGCDAVVTDAPGLVVTIRVADCLPVLLADASGRIGLVHAGWRGLDGGIVEAALDRFADPREVEAVLGPGIGVCCFEVGGEVAERFPRARSRPVRGGRDHVDLAAEAGRRLVDRGVRAAAVRGPGPCTRCHQHLLHSHRGSGGAAGRILAFARSVGAR